MSQTYYAILTATGEAKLANATALGTQLQISKMAVGDGNGNLPTPNRSQTALVNERYRANLNNLMVDPKNASQIIAELIIPETEGGYWLREMALFDAAGDMVAVSNCPPSYKPQMSEGSGRTQVLRMVLVVSSAEAVQLKIDPSVVLATREYVDSSLLAALNKQDYKHSVQLATTAAIALNGLQTVDGVALSAGARVLVKNQAAGKDNGIYVVASGPWARAADADASIEVTPGLFVHVEQGAVGADTVWQLTTDAPISLGTTALVFEQIAGPSGVAAGTYRSVTVDRNGRVLGGTNPTTLEGLGIADAYTKTQVDAFVVQATESVKGTARIATDAQMLDGSNDAVVVTPKKFRKGFAISLTTNGYIAFPTWLGGLVVQWGTTATLVGDSDNAVPFQMAFPNAGLVAHVTPLNTDSSLYKDNTGQVKSITATTLTIRCNVISGNMTYSPYMWLALGY